MEAARTVPSMVTHNSRSSEYDLYLQDESKFLTFSSQEKSYCNGSLVPLNNGGIFIRNLILDPTMSYKSRVHGGESLFDFFELNEIEEYFQFRKGYFQLLCRERPTLHSKSKSLISKGMEAIRYLDKRDSTKLVKVENSPTLMIERIEYSNLYHAMTEWYNVFIVLEELNLKDHAVNILFVDKHPRSILDDVWKRLFRRIEFADKLSSNQRFVHAFWMPSAYKSAMNNHKLVNLPYVEHFRSFFLYNFGFNDEISTDLEMINITFIWRRDFVFHARNQNGTIQRKFANEETLLLATKRAFPSFNVIGIQLEKLSFTDQLRLITGTSILIAMHGAGLAHVLFLPRGSGVFEIFPKYVNSAGNGHFRAMARWRKLHYVSWRNYQSRNEEENFKTRIPQEIVLNYIKILYWKMFKKEIPYAKLV
ncbi:hypothetical protein FSP39_006687 [Pinctada imbricata]|uniref:Glycosyltransferase 61 catalytic domain-containing protein n=1 Tax=Pinctada imbricata TaxID=66713 RepID=A0AA88Y3Y2_PINIB|nr:hypothetical protein FSP39_006687 [Pinctada imbricata]